MLDAKKKYIKYFVSNRGTMLLRYFANYMFSSINIVSLLFLIKKNQHLASH